MSEQSKANLLIGRTEIADYAVVSTSTVSKWIRLKWLVVFGSTRQPRCYKADVDKCLLNLRDTESRKGAAGKWPV